MPHMSAPGDYEGLHMHIYQLKFAGLVHSSSMWVPCYESFVAIYHQIQVPSLQVNYVVNP